MFSDPTPTQAEKPETCHYCVFLRFLSPEPIEEDGELLGISPGMYTCRKFGMRIADAHETPTPLKPGCKRVGGP